MANNSIFMRFPNGLSKAVTLSYDDGVAEDIRLIDIMKQHGLKGTFNLNSGRILSAEEENKTPKAYGMPLTAEQAKQVYSQDGIEVAVHGFTHPFLHSMPTASAARDVLEDRVFLEKLFERPIRGMAYPFGTYSDQVVDVLSNCGIAYSRTVISTEKFDIPKDWLRLPATCHHKNPRLNELTDKFLNKTHSNTEAPWMFYLWGHTYEFARCDNWNVIEEFAQRIGGKEDIWYATNMEIYSYTRAYESLIFSVEMDYVTNPTAQTVWFILRGKLRRVDGGQTVKLD